LILKPLLGYLAALHRWLQPFAPDPGLDQENASRYHHILVSDPDEAGWSWMGAISAALTEGGSQACWEPFSQIVETGLQIAAPALWLCEMTSGLARAVHFKVLSPDDARRGLLQITELGVHLISPDAEQNR
jgi:hypothetical protein